jgi:beta-N-acetylhexosaminidase
MSLRDDAGQLLVLGLDGTELTSLQASWLRLLQPGGIVLFQRNIADQVQTRVLLDAAGAQCETPPFRCVDLEGGSVNRLRTAVGEITSAETVAATGSPDLAERHGELIGEAASAFGFDTVFAPVLDLALPASRAVMGTRTAAETGDGVVKYARPFLNGLQRAGVRGCGKHFPGLGGGRLDSHLHLPRIQRDWSALWAEDLLPYRELKAELPMVMVAHAAYSRVGGENGPASQSHFWIKTVLRRRIGYRGLVISDDLEMQAVLRLGIESVAVGAIRAGSDLYMVCHDPGLITLAYEAVLGEAEKSAAFRRAVRESAARLRKAKAAAPRKPSSGKRSGVPSLEKLRASFEKLAKECSKA